MDDVSSIGSASTADEFCVVNADPTVRRHCDSGNFQSSMTEAMADMNSAAAAAAAAPVVKDNPFNNSALDDDGDNIGDRDAGGAAFSSKEQDIEEAPDGARTPTASSLNLDSGGQEGISYCDMLYLGSVSVSRARDEDEIQRYLSQCDTAQAKPASIFVPYTNRGSVRVLDQSDKRLLLEEHPVTSIAYCCVGRGHGLIKRFAFTVSEAMKSGELQQQQQQRVVMLYAPSDAAALSVVNQMAQAFRSYDLPDSGTQLHQQQQDQQPDLRPCLGLRLLVDIQEQDGKGAWSSVPVDDKYDFKVRQSHPKRLHLTVQQTAGRKVNISRCFGLLLRVGSQPDAVCLPLSMGPDSDGYSVCAVWPGAEALVASDQLISLRLCVDLVLEAISDPLRLKYDALIRVYRPEERFWLASLTSNLQQRRLPGRSFVFRHQNSALVNENSASDTDSDDNDPLPSGSGQVSKEITNAELTDEWVAVINRWQREQTAQAPSSVRRLVRRGVPESLRPQVWSLLGRSQQASPVTADYSDLSCKDAPEIEAAIARDISRTYTACPDFAEGGAKREDLARLSKAYALYDPAVGYCQGMSFLGAALLLQLPEEEAFELLVQIMYDYGVRKMFTAGFEGLQLRFYQLDALLKQHCPEVFSHFKRLGCEPHMYASQWFLTLFTSKFPLTAVNRVLDVFLSEGDSALLKLAVALLTKARPDLLGKDFESVMRYFRVSLPKAYRSTEAVEDLVSRALSLKGISTKRLDKLAKEFQAEQEAGKERTRDYRSDCMRLQEENDCLARELLHSQTQNRMQQDLLEDKLDVVQTELLLTKQMLTEKDDEALKLAENNARLKDMVRELTTDCDKRTGIIDEYKQIVSRLSDRLNSQDQQQRSATNSTTPTTAAPTTAATTSSSDYSELEVELAKTKLALVEAECRCQALEHQVNSFKMMQQRPSATSSSSSGSGGGLSQRFTKAVSSFANKTASSSSSGQQQQQMPPSVSEHCLSSQLSTM
ncbi:hypothetical protein BOX15_Mlig023352g1 [Macrostomum lignano]|uniref:Rab-GAP TBC domain-containing protein n=2 Tax=Macrostomum lignano TaxID=282301 RepID=A0A267FEQ9_9PLAT|nr:hypothetical protein BOX15_Mlig023352g1 [Macrostomum lignano]